MSACHYWKVGWYQLVLVLALLCFALPLLVLTIVEVEDSLPRLPCHLNGLVIGRACVVDVIQAAESDS